MTVLQAAYAELRDQGRGHHAALRDLARRYSLDKDTIGRVLRRAEQNESRPVLRWEPEVGGCVPCRAGCGSLISAGRNHRCAPERGDRGRRERREPRTLAGMLRALESAPSGGPSWPWPTNRAKRRRS